jgi:hypothetical protein
MAAARLHPSAAAGGARREGGGACAWPGNAAIPGNAHLHQPEAWIRFTVAAQREGPSFGGTHTWWGRGEFVIVGTGFLSPGRAATSSSRIPPTANGS